MRLYNGCPDKELKAVMDAKAKALADAENAGFHITYFPAEGQYMAFKGYHSASGFHDHPRQALEEARA